MKNRRVKQVHPRDPRLGSRLFARQAAASTDAMTRRASAKSGL